MTHMMIIKNRVTMIRLQDTNMIYIEMKKLCPKKIEIVREKLRQLIKQREDSLILTSSIECRAKRVKGVLNVN